MPGAIAARVRGRSARILSMTEGEKISRELMAGANQTSRSAFL
jgi:hypothetical protein